MKHTDGEWKVRFMNPNGDDGECDFFIEAPNPNQPHAIEIMGDDYGEHNGYPREQRLADANLISASKELLKSSKELRDFLTMNLGDEKLNKIRDGLFIHMPELYEVLKQTQQAIQKAES